MAGNVKDSPFKDYDKLLKPPMQYSEGFSPLVFPNPDKQVREVFNIFFGSDNLMASAEHSLSSTFSQNSDGPPLADRKVTNAMGLYEDNEMIQQFVLYSFYLLRLRTISSRYGLSKEIPLELLPLQKLGLYDNMEWLEQSVSLNFDTEFRKLYPRAFFRLKNTLEEFPFFIERHAPIPDEPECYCVDTTDLSGWLITNIAQEDCGTEGGYPGHEWDCVDYSSSPHNSEREAKIIQEVNDHGVSYVDVDIHNRGRSIETKVAIYDDEHFGIDHVDEKWRFNAMPWSEVYREHPRVRAITDEMKAFRRSTPGYRGDLVEVTNFMFEHYKTKWNNEAYPDRFFMTPQQFLIKSGYCYPDYYSFKSFMAYTYPVRSIATYLQGTIRMLHEQNGDLSTLLSKQSLSYGLKLIAGDLYIPEGALMGGDASPGHTWGGDPLKPAGAAINAESADLRITGTFTSLAIDPEDRKYIEEQYYRFRDNKELQ